MKALALTGYDGLTSLQFGQYAVPSLGPDDVLIDVHAASINPVDVRITSGYLRGRVDFDLPHVLGRDCAGIVRQVGRGVRRLKSGDAVIGVADQKRWGTHAECVVIDQATVARKPPALSNAQATSICIAGLSALAGLVTAGNLRAGERVLIHAGAGGVGSLGIQLAKYIGAFVAATAGPVNLAYVRGLGADVVIDYTTTDFRDVLKNYDLVFDVLGGEVRLRSLDVLRPGGRITHLSGPPMQQSAPRGDVTVIPVNVDYGAPCLDKVSALIATGAVKPTISSVFAFDDAVAAYDIVRSGHARGKIVLDLQS